MSWMLPITLKRFNAVDWKKLESHVSEQDESLGSAVTALNTQREILRATTERTENILSQYYKYYAQISSIDQRVPVSEQEIRVSFTWYDVYKERKVSQYSLAFEKASILWNIMAIHSHLGAAEKRTTEESIKIAAKNFQTATGVLGMIKKELESHPAASANLDMSLDNLSFLTNLMNGQSQECYYDLALKGGKMPQDAVAKLAWQVASFHSKAASLAEGALKDSYVPRKWLSYTKLKHSIFSALTYYHMSFERLASGAYGEQVSRLTSAHKMLELAKKERLDKYIPELTESLNSTSSKIATAYSSAHKDNSTIYFELVPAESKLPQPAGHTMAKAVEPEPAKLTLSDDPFAKIVPFTVQKADSLYCERRGEVIRSIVKKVEENDGMARTVLAELGLPASLDSLESGSSINTLQAKITTIQNEGGVTMLKERQSLLDQIAEADQALLHEALAILDAEELEDKTSRQQYAGDGWSRTPSHTLNAHLRQEAHKFMANFEQARKSDDYIKSRFASAVPHIHKLAALNRDLLERELPKDGSETPTNAIAGELRTRVVQVEHLPPARSSLVAQLRDLASNDNIINKLLAQPNRDADEDLFAKELAKYDTLIAQIEATFATQSQLLQKVTSMNAEFLASRQVTPAMEQRQAILQTYEGAFQAYCDLKAHLKEGAEFYTKFQDLLAKFKTKCGDFALARKTELQDVIEDMRARKAASSTTASPAHSPSPISYSAYPSAPAASPHSSNVQISKPTSVASPATTFNHPSSIYSAPGGYNSSPSAMPQQMAVPGYYQAAPGQAPMALPPGYSPVVLPPGFSFQPPPQY